MSAKAAIEHPPLIFLVAEDEENDVLLLKRAFNKAGIQARLFFVSNGQDAIHYLKGEAPYADRVAYPFPNVLLLDLNMPGLGGLGVLEWLAARPRFEGLRVVVFSSFVAPNDCQYATSLGAHSCLTKPLDPVLLLPILPELQCGTGALGPSSN